MSSIRPYSWPHVSRMSHPVMLLRNVVARSSHVSAGRWYKRHGLRYRLALGLPLEHYPVWITLDGGMGLIEVGMALGSVRPEFGTDLLESVASDAQRIEVLEWLVMPWLDELESLVGCEVKVTALAMRHRPPTDLVPLSVDVDGDRRAHVALAGPGLGVLARALSVADLPLPAWCRLEAVALLALRGLTMDEMKALVRGALLRLRPSTLQVRIGTGGSRMTAHWTDDEGAQLDGPAETGGADMSGLQPLVGLEQLTFDIDVIVATMELSIAELSGICKGAVLPLKPPCDGLRVALLHRGAVFARGELVYVEDEMAVMITECLASPAA